MPLVACPECGRSVSTQAMACPGCGLPSPGRPEIPHSEISRSLLEALLRMLDKLESATEESKVKWLSAQLAVLPALWFAWSSRSEMSEAPWILWLGVPFFWLIGWLMIWLCFVALNLIASNARDLLKPTRGPKSGAAGR